MILLLWLCFNRSESVQRKFTMRLVGFNEMSYPARLNALNLPSLERRRLRADLILTYRIIFWHTDLDMNDYLVLKNLNTLPLL